MDDDIKKQLEALGQAIKDKQTSDAKAIADRAAADSAALVEFYRLMSTVVVPAIGELRTTSEQAGIAFKPTMTKTDGGKGRDVERIYIQTLVPGKDPRKPPAIELTFSSRGVHHILIEEVEPRSSNKTQMPLAEVTATGIQKYVSNWLNRVFRG